MNRHPLSADRRPSAISAAVKPVLEMLEGRTFLSVTTPVVAENTATLRNHTLLVQGSARGDTIEIVRQPAAEGEGLRVTINKVLVGVFGLDEVSVIRGYGLGGSDKFVVSEANGPIVTPTYLFGGNGNDSLTGSSAADTIVGGKGNDLLDGRGGNDWIDGSNGNDRILGGDGKDRLTGGPGNDVINTGAGRDVLLGRDAGDVVDTGAAQLLQPASTFATTRGPAAFNGTVVGLTPQQIRTAYQFGNLGNHAFKNRGQGQTIAIVVAFHYPTALNDVNVFSNTFGLKRLNSTSFQYVFATGDKPAVNAAWSAEAALDVEWAHAIAPASKIVLVEASSSLPADLSRAAAKAVDVLHLAGGGVVAMSFTGDEALADRTTYHGVFLNHKTGDISFVGAAGDVEGQLAAPGVDPEVLSVGGTFLDVDAAGNRIDEMAAADSGGGTSAIFDRPDYQNNLVVDGGNVGSKRVVPDVAYDADPLSAVAVYNTTPNTLGDTGWNSASGTSVGTPQWAGLVALANQKRVANKLPVIGNGQLNNYIYGIARKFNTQTFNDITTGNNATHPATEGFDRATGWGTPKATALIDRLAIALSQNSVSSRVSLKFQWTADFYKDNVQADAQNSVVNLAGTGKAQIGPSAANLTFVENNDFDRETGISSAPMNQIDLSATGLRRKGTQVKGTGIASVVTFDGYSASFPVRFVGRILRLNGVDHVRGRFYAIDSGTGALLKIGQLPVLSGRFVTRGDNF